MEQPYSPYVKNIKLLDGSEISVGPASVLFVVGPNNGGKSTFLRELALDHQSSQKPLSNWVSAVEWNLGLRSQFDEFVGRRYKPHSGMHAIDINTNNQVLKLYTLDFYEQQRLGSPEFLIRTLNAQNRISLSDKVNLPDVTNGLQLHPYHTFFFKIDSESKFSDRIKLAFNYEFRINRTGSNTIAYLGKPPSFERLSLEYEKYIVEEMSPINQFGDGVRSYVGILLNFFADPRPVTIIDEPEAFLHPPQAYKLGREIAELAKQQNRQAIVATHSSDIIKGSLAAEGCSIQFLYLNHAANNKHHIVYSSDVSSFSKEPFLRHTDALDALFYSTTVVCEGDADIMFFKWALDKSNFKNLDDVFWIPSYGKSAVPGILGSMKTLGVTPKCVFDIDVLITPEILYRCCDILDIDLKDYKKFIESIPGLIKIPPVTETLSKIGDALNNISEEDDDASRIKIIRDIKKFSESLSRSWSLKTTGLRLIPKGDDQRKAKSLLDHLGKNGIIVLKEGEIENYGPTLGGHGRSWVRQMIETDEFEPDMQQSLIDQFGIALPQ